MQKLIDIIDQPNWKVILYDLVKTHELDLWNIDLINLSNLYLAKINDLENQSLVIPANALLAAAILLKLKTYSLKLTTIDDEEDIDELKLLKDDDLMLNSAIDLNTPTRLKEGQVSLDELIDVIDLIMNKPTKKNIERNIKKLKEEVQFVIPEKTKDITQRINEFYDEIKNTVDSENLVLFSKILKLEKDPSNIVSNYFIPLLFLAMDKRIDVWQEEFFSEIFIRIVK
jgi:segregation and condensation protein A